LSSSEEELYSELEELVRRRVIRQPRKCEGRRLFDINNPSGFQKKRHLPEDVFIHVLELYIGPQILKEQQRYSTLLFCKKYMYIQAGFYNYKAIIVIFTSTGGHLYQYPDSWYKCKFHCGKYLNNESLSDLYKPDLTHVNYTYKYYKCHFTTVVVLLYHLKFEGKTFGRANN